MRHFPSFSFSRVQRLVSSTELVLSLRLLSVACCLFFKEKGKKKEEKRKKKNSLFSFLERRNQILHPLSSLKTFVAVHFVRNRLGSPRLGGKIFSGTVFASIVAKCMQKFAYSHSLMLGIGLRGC